MSELMTTHEWNNLPWRKLERKVFKLQKRIYQASSRGNTETVRNLQRLLIKSWSAKCIAVRRVTQDNQGKKTAGVDGVKSLSPEARLKLAKQLRITGKSKPTLRVWIPKPGKDEKRPLGIPTIHDRALQALVKIALEPEWEAKFEPNSYGFRPGRSTHDAIEAVFKGVKSKEKFILDADIAKCFDKINHYVLLKKLNTFPSLSRQIKAWLKSGVMDGKELFPTQEGTPQGGVISPLLANVALHGLETLITNKFKRLSTGQNKRTAAILVRYADDFVVIHEHLSVIEQSKQLISQWLSNLGLELKESKTKIVSSKTGFDFLGFNIKQYSVSDNHSSRNTKGEILGFKTLIKPSDESIKRVYEQLRDTIDRYGTAPQVALIKKLNPIIKGWANYYSTVCSTDTYNDLDSLLYNKLQQWARRRHSKKTNGWVAIKYWHVNEGKWDFRAEEDEKRISLLKFYKTKINRHIKVQGSRSPFDGDWIYWSSRMGRSPEISKKVAKLLKEQQGKCGHCGNYFDTDSVMEIHHLDGNHKNNKTENLQLLHRHCHDNKHFTTKGMYDKHRVIEEPYECESLMYGSEDESVW
jgi:RNA-directed DNA polymerase